MERKELKELILKEKNPIVKQKLKDLLKKVDLLIKEQKPLISDLKKVGIKVESVWDLVNNRDHSMLKALFVGKYNVAYPILVKHLDYKYSPRITEGIIRALTEKDAKDCASEKILEMFIKEKDKGLKWVMANALRTLMTWKERQKYPEIAEILKGI